MPTSVYLPPPLLAAVERRAKRLKISRNRFIVMTLESELAHETQWSEGFFESLIRLGPDDAKAVDEMLDGIRAARTSKKPPRL